MQRAVELDPLNADRKIFLGEIFMQAGRPEQSEEQLKAALQLDPVSHLAHSVLQTVRYPRRTG